MFKPLYDYARLDSIGFAGVNCKPVFFLFFLEEFLFVPKVVVIHGKM